ncbi:MAG: alanine dehydrogenase [Kiritimatiellae bacterium]|nr:alanine dehydrogenase [Kiritimatiellia bacterium]
MKIGIPKEIKPQERRVGMYPSGVKALVDQGHSVVLESGAGEGCGLTDSAYRGYGARIGHAADAWEQQMVVKVKEPQPAEYPFLREDLLLYTYLHLAADKMLTDELVRSKCAAIAYETVQLPDRSLPLLAPMSEVAGRMSITKAAEILCHYNGGTGQFIGGVIGTRPCKVVVIGGGVAGSNAAEMAVGLGADVTVLDTDTRALRRLHHDLGGRLRTLFSNSANIAEEVAEADVVISCVLIPGAAAPKLISRDLVAAMKPGSVIIDIAIDQGGTTELSRPTTHADPCVRASNGVNIYCVTNMPGAYPRTSTEALSNATLRYALKLADRGWAQACREDEALRKGLNVAQGAVTHTGVAEACGYACRSVFLTPSVS